MINPIGRYRYAQRMQTRTPPVEIAPYLIKMHDRYWKSEDNMREGNPMLALERGEKVELPPAIWVQSRADEIHNYHDEDSSFPGKEMERFAANYRKAGGSIDLEYVEGSVDFTEAQSSFARSGFHDEPSRKHGSHQGTPWL